IGVTNGNKPGLTSTGTDIPTTNDSVAFGPAAGITQLTPWGGQWLVGLANSTLWFWADGKGTDATTSTLSYSLIQPLLAGAGKRIVLENLTQSERNMLYAVRDFARYRMGFFTQIAVGGNVAGVTPVSQPGVGTGVSPLGSPTLQGGYLGLIQQMQIIANQEFNIRLLLSNLDKTRNRVSQPRRPYEVVDALPEGVTIPDSLSEVVYFRREIMLDELNRPIVGDDGKPELEGRLYIVDRLTDEQRDQLVSLSDDPKWTSVIRTLVEQAGQATRNQQVAQLETQLASLYNQLRANRTTFQNNVDQYKITLGLPTSLPVTIDRDLLKPFELVDPRLNRLVDRLEGFVPDPPAGYETHPDAVAMQRVNQLMQQYNVEDPDQQVLQGLILELFVLKDDLARDAIVPLDTDFDHALDHLAKRKTVAERDPGLEPYNAAKFRELHDRQIEEFKLLETQLQNLRKKVLEKNLSLEARKAIAAEVNDVREGMIALTQGVTGVEANLRMELIDLNEYDMEMETAVEIGLDNRLDLKNVQGQLMDARRKVEVAANQLQAVLNITAAGDIRTHPLTGLNNNPFDFRGDESNIRLGIQFTTPIQLVQQRNTYRAALVGFQQARRNYMRVEDSVKFDVRTTWRNIDLNRRNFETAKANVRAAVIQYDIAVEQASAPTGVAPAGGGGGLGGGAGGANQGLNILNALNSLLRRRLLHRRLLSAASPPLGFTTRLCRSPDAGAEQQPLRSVQSQSSATPQHGDQQCRAETSRPGPADARRTAEARP
ncbi:MAG: TolC family protein, partial [Planctomycetota bacterium]|nr:TolC family protein [Planctomycetota bacterium]